MRRWIRRIAAIALSSAAIASGIASPEARGEESPVAGRADDETAPPGEGEPGPRVRARSRGAAIALKGSPVSVPIEPVAERAGVAPKGVAEQVKSLRAGDRLHLVLTGPGTDAPPGVLYDLYLDLPPNPTAEQKRAHAVGTINFFGFVGRGGEADDPKDRPVLSFDVTQVARRLQAEGKLKDAPVLTIIPAGEPDRAARPVIAEVALTGP